MIAASPKATVPVLVVADGRVLDESLDIMRWALGRNDPDNWLDGDNAEMIAANDGPFKHHLDRYKYPNRHGTDAVEHRAAGLDYLRSLDARLVTQSNLAGDAMGLADAAIMPFVRQFAETHRNWFDAQPLANLHAWLARHMSSALFHDIMVRLKPWKAGDSPTLFGE